MFQDIIHTLPPRLMPSRASCLPIVVHISLLFSFWGQPSNSALISNLSDMPSSHGSIDLFRSSFRPQNNFYPPKPGPRSSLTTLRPSADLSLPSQYTPSQLPPPISHANLTTHSLSVHLLLLLLLFHLFARIPSLVASVSATLPPSPPRKVVPTCPCRGTSLVRPGFRGRQGMCRSW